MRRAGGREGGGAHAGLSECFVSLEPDSPAGHLGSALAARYARMQAASDAHAAGGAPSAGGWQLRHEAVLERLTMELMDLALAAGGAGAGAGAGAPQAEAAHTEPTVIQLEQAHFDQFRTVFQPGFPIESSAEWLVKTASGKYLPDTPTHTADGTETTADMKACLLKVVRMLLFDMRVPDPTTGLTYTKADLDEEVTSADLVTGAGAAPLGLASVSFGCETKTGSQAFVDWDRSSPRSAARKANNNSHANNSGNGARRGGAGGSSSHNNSRSNTRNYEAGDRQLLFAVAAHKRYAGPLGNGRGGWIARTRTELLSIMNDDTSDADLKDGARIYRRALKESLERMKSYSYCASGHKFDRAVQRALSTEGVLHINTHAAREAAARAAASVAAASESPTKRARTGAGISASGTTRNLNFC